MYQNQMGMSQYRVGMPQFSAGINWVNSVQEVDQFELPPGGVAVFFDKVTDGMMYIRSRDTYNIYSTKVFSITEVKPKQPESPYVTRNELEEMFQRFLGGMNNVTVQPTNGATGTANATDTAAIATDQSAGVSKRKEDGTDITGVK